MHSLVLCVSPTTALLPLLLLLQKGRKRVENWLNENREYCFNLTKVVRESFPDVFAHPELMHGNPLRGLALQADGTWVHRGQL